MSHKQPDRMSSLEEVRPSAFQSPGDGWSRWPAGAGRELKRYWDVLRAHRVLVGAVFVTVVAAVYVGTLLQTPVYRASGVIEIKKVGSELVPVDALFEASRLSAQYLETQYEILRSPGLASRVIAELRLDELDEFRPGGGFFSREKKDADPARTLQVVTERFLDRLIIDPVGESQLIRIHFESEDPRVAADAVNTLISSFARMRADASRMTVTRLAAQVDSVRDKLASVERALHEFTQENQLLFYESPQGEAESISGERLRRLQQELLEAEADRFEKESRYRMLQAQGTGSVTGEVIQSLSVNAAALRGEYARLRSTFSDEYPAVQEVRRQLEGLEREIARERERIAGEITNEYLGALERESLLRRALAEQLALIDRLGNKALEFRLLEREAAAQQQLYTLLQQRLREAEVAAALVSTEVGIVDQARVPLSPVRPDTQRNLSLAMVVGLMLGVGGAFLREYTMPTIRSPEEVGSLAVPVLGLLPAVRQGVNDVSVMEAFANLRTSILFQDPNSCLKSLLLTSAQPGEGKSTVSLNLALSISKLGKRVILIDADLRRPVLHQMLSTGLTPGLAEFLESPPSDPESGSDWPESIQQSVRQNLDFLPAGTSNRSPSELLVSDAMRNVLAEAEKRYDFVVVDAPAMHMNIPDTRILASLVSGTAVVIRSGMTPRDVIMQVLDQIPNLTGVVLNDVEDRQLPAYYRSYDQKQLAPPVT